MAERQSFVNIWILKLHVCIYEKGGFIYLTTALVIDDIVYTHI